MVIDEWEYHNVKLELDKSNTLVQSFNITHNFINWFKSSGYQVHNQIWQEPNYLFTFKRPIRSIEE